MFCIFQLGHPWSFRSLMCSIPPFGVSETSQEIDDLSDIGRELGCDTTRIHNAYNDLQKVCILVCKAKLIYDMYSPMSTDKVQMKKCAIQISNHSAAFEIDPTDFAQLSGELKAMKKLQFVPPK